jgi:hypothetical protein
MMKLRLAIAALVAAIFAPAPHAVAAGVESHAVAIERGIPNSSCQ